MRNKHIFKFLCDAEKGLVAEVPNEIPRTYRVYKDNPDYKRGWLAPSSVVDRSVRICSSKCIVCGIRKPLIDHHVFNQKTAANAGIEHRGSPIVTLCPNCHALIHENGTSKKAFYGELVVE